MCINVYSCVFLCSGEGVFECTLEVPEDGCYQYKFLVDGQWMFDSLKVELMISYDPCVLFLHLLLLYAQPTVEDSFGGMNNVLDTTM